jgi:hypothetical protein
VADREGGMIDLDELTEVFKMHTVGAQTFTRRMAILMADWFNTTPKQIVVRLEAAKLIPEGSWDWFAANGGITVDHIREVREGRP